MIDENVVCVSKEVGLRGNIPFRGKGWEGDHKDMELIWMAINGSHVSTNLEHEKSLAKNLQERGYDLSTLNFSIKKKVPTE